MAWRAPSEADLRGRPLPQVTYYIARDGDAFFLDVAQRHIAVMQEYGVQVTERQLRFDADDKAEKPVADISVAVVSPLFCDRHCHDVTVADAVRILQRRHRRVVGLEMVGTDNISAAQRVIASHPAVDAVILPSEFARDVFKKVGVHGHIAVVPYGIDVAEPSTRFASLRGNTHRNVLVRLQDGEYRMWWDHTIELLSLSKDRICVVVQASKELREAYRIDATLREAGCDFHVVEGPLSAVDLASLYQHCDVLLSLKRGGGPEIVEVEALAHGLPVLATACGTTPAYLPQEWQLPVLGYYALRTTLGNCAGRGAVVDKPNAHLVLQSVFAAPEQARARAAELATDLRLNHTWAAISRGFIAYLQEVSGPRKMPSS